MAANQLTAAQAAAALATWQELDRVLGLGRKQGSQAPPEILALLEERQSARRARDFKKADQLRDQLKSKGWLIEDTPKGAKLKRV